MSWPIERDCIIALSLFSVILVLIPATWHIRSWNTGYLLASFWIGCQCLLVFIGAIIWRNNVTNWAPAFCDITIRIDYASSVGVVSAGLVISRRVSEIASGRMIRHSRRRVILTDLAIGLIPPMIQIILYHRFDIFEDLGCQYAVNVTLLTLFLSDLWPVVIGTASMCYSVTTLRSLYRRRKERLDLQQMCEGITYDQYYRLIFMVTLEMAATVPLSIWVIAFGYTPPIDPSWKNFATHQRGLDRVEQIPTMSWLSDDYLRRGHEESEWIGIACAICYFAAFGTTKEARDRYRSVVLKFLHLLGIRRGADNRSAGNGPKENTLVFAGQSVIGSQTGFTVQGVSMEGVRSTEFRPSAESTFTRGREENLVESV